MYHRWGVLSEFVQNVTLAAIRYCHLQIALTLLSLTENHLTAARLGQQMLQGLLRLTGLGYVVLLGAFFALPRVCSPQQDVARSNKTDFLPPTTGESFTVTTIDRHDIDCSVVTWNAEAAKPTLTVLCPPEEILAPLHVYLKVSWLKSEDVPVYARMIQAPARTPTKLRTDRTAVWIWLGVQEKQDAPPRRKWVAFTGVVDLALLSLPGKR